LNYPTVKYEWCYAKTTHEGSPGVDVYKHCVIAGHVARALIRHLPTPLQEAIQVDAGLVAALHDVGKVSPGYQLKYFREHLKQICPELAAETLTNFESDHACVSEAAICQKLGVKYWDDVRAGFARIAGCHHGGGKEVGVNSDTGRYLAVFPGARSVRG